MDRRDFLRLASNAALALGAKQAGVDLRGRRLWNHRLGVEVSRPRSWTWGSIADFVALRDQQVTYLPDDEGLPFDFDELPVFVIEEDDEDDWGGAIILYSEVPDGDSVYDVDPEGEPAAHGMMLMGFSRAYRDLEVLEPAWDIELAGGQWATAAEWSYRHDLDDGRHGWRWIRSIVVFWRDAEDEVVRVDTFFMGDDLNGGRRRVPPAVWDRFVAEIQYAEKSGFSTVRRPAPNKPRSTRS